MRNNKAARAAALLAMLGAATLAGAQGSMFEALSSEGQGMTLLVDAQKDGSVGVTEMGTNEAGEMAYFRTKGRTTLRSAKLNLDADTLTFDPVKNTVTAEGDVEVDQDGVQATSEYMLYNLETAELFLSGTPIVEQQTATSRSRFSGMAEFFLIREESGATRIRMIGGEEILCEMSNVDPPALEVQGNGDAAPTATVNGTETTLTPGAGFAGFGENVRITTRPRPDQVPTVLADANADGEFARLQCFGSVFVESDEMRLRSDELEYDAAAGVVYARRNVFIEQQNIDADCQMMEYTIATGRIVLTGKPEIRDQRPTGVYTISRLAAYIITRAPDGSVSTQSVAGPDGPSRTEFTPIEAARPTPDIPDVLPVEGEIILPPR
jgi:lipopolysaccharide export system protein LptA